MPVAASVVDREHHHDVLQAIRLRLDDHGDPLEAELDRAPPAPLTVEDHIPSAVLEDGEGNEDAL
jgi:hypothetical protein